MSSAKMEPANNLTRLFEQFAGQNIATRPDLSRSVDFPADLWGEMAATGLLGVGIDRKYGGRGGGAFQIQEAGRKLVSKGHCLGLALSWLIHCASARYVVGNLGTEEQRERLLPLMARGERTASIAVSEPGVGAHPKGISTRAVPVPGGYEISGRKAYLTNGPIAGLFIVAAVTDEAPDKKEFSAFLVPRDTPGLVVEEAMHLEMLRPSPHCGIALEKVFVPAGALLGEPGSAWNRMVKPFRTVEDVLLMGPILGGMDALAGRLGASIMEHGPSDRSKAEEDFGHFASILLALSVVAGKAAELLDGEGDENVITGLCLAFRAMAADILLLLDRVKSAYGARFDENMERLALDMAAGSSIAANVAASKQKKLGRRFLGN